MTPGFNTSNGVARLLLSYGQLDGRVLKALHKDTEDMDERRTRDEDRDMDRSLLMPDSRRRPIIDSHRHPTSFNTKSLRLPDGQHATIIDKPPGNGHESFDQIKDAAYNMIFAVNKTA